MKRLLRKRGPRRAAKGALPRLVPLAIEMETEPYRQDWLRLTPGQRMARVWRMRRRLKDPEAAHDALSFPRL